MTAQKDLAPLNAPPAAAPTPGVQAGGTPGIVVARQVVVFGPNGGIFVYSPVPGHGNLVASIAAMAGTDRYGNHYDAGINAYGTGPAGGTIAVIGFSAGGTFPAMGFASGAASEVDPAAIDLNVFNPNTTSEQISWNLFGPEGSASSDDRVGMQLLDSSVASPGIATGFLNYQGSSFTNDVAAWGTAGFGILLGSKVVAAQPGTSGATLVGEGWHSIPLAAGYATGAAVPEYTYELGNTGRVRLRGNVALTANQLAGAVFATMPTGYVPAFNQVLPMTPNNMAGNSFNNGNVQVFTTGSLAFGSSGNNGNTFWLDGLTYALA